MPRISASPLAGDATLPFVRRHPVLAVWAIGLLLYAGDFLVKRVPLWREPFNVWISVDDIVPFAPDWAYVYIWAWLAIIFGLAGVYVWQNRHDWGRVRALVLAAVIMQVSAWIVHYAIPTTFPRPSVPAELIEAGHLIWTIYSTDPPTHALPSLHMASIFVAAWFFCRDRAVWRTLLGVACVVLISLSVMYTKQHGFIDVFAGIGWGWMAAIVGVRVSAAIERRRLWLKAGQFQARTDGAGISGDGATADHEPADKQAVGL